MRILAAILALSLALSAQTKTTDTSSNGHLPVKRVVLYKNGVGYFEHVGKVRGTEDINIDFTSSQLDDVLKSLTVVDLGDGRVTGVRYNSTAPLDQRLRGLRIPLGANPTREQLLNALRGAHVEVRSGSATVMGKILSVETRAQTNSRTDNTTQVTELALISDAGEMRTFELNGATGVRITDKDLSQELNRYLTLIGSSRAKDVRRLTIATAGTGDRDLFVSYISEVPIWKTTYRIVIPTDPKKQPLLQGWAVVDNTIGEDWTDVKLSLVAGAPQSFVQQISTPYYSRRPVVALPETAQLSPQMHEETEVSAETVEVDAAEALNSPAVMPASPPPPVGGQYHGNLDKLDIYSQLNKVTTKSGSNSYTAGRNLAPLPSSATRNSVMESQFTSAASHDIGELFSYDIKQSITIGKDQSALVPIVQARVEAMKVTLWTPGGGTPRNALWLRNSSGSTLDSGSFSIVEGDSFAGEGLLETLKPAERRLLSYAGDSSIHVKDETDSDLQPISHVRIVRGLMTVTRQQRNKETYSIRNADKEVRNVVIEHPVRAGWKFVGDLKPEETSDSYHRFLVKVDPGTTAKLEVAEYHPTESQVLLTNLTSDDVLLYSRQRVLTPEVEASFRKVLDQKNQIAGFDQQLRMREQEISNISADQNRVRENMKALKGSAEEKALLQRYATQLNSQEDRLASLRTEMSTLRDQREQAIQQLDQTLMAMSLDSDFQGQ